MQTYFLIEEQILTINEEPTRAESILSTSPQTAVDETVFDYRRMIKRWNGQYEMYSSKERLTSLSKVFEEKYLELGADISQKDSHGGTVANYFN